jgi:hypothetical protein
VISIYASDLLVFQHFVFGFQEFAAALDDVLRASVGLIFQIFARVLAFADLLRQAAQVVCVIRTPAFCHSSRRHVAFQDYFALIVKDLKRLARFVYVIRMIEPSSHVDTSAEGLDGFVDDRIRSALLLPSVAGRLGVRGAPGCFPILRQGSLGHVRAGKICT